MTKIRSTRLYTVLYPGGYKGFESRESDDGEITPFSTIQAAAETLAARCLDTPRGTRFDIDFRPFHDVELCLEAGFRRCSELTEAERTEFWEAFHVHYQEESDERFIKQNEEARSGSRPSDA